MQILTFDTSFKADVFDGFDGRGWNIIPTPGRTGSGRGLSPYSQRDAMATSRFVYWNHTRRSPRAQQKGRNSRTAYRFSTHHRSREYLPVIFRSLFLSFSRRLTVSFSILFLFFSRWLLQRTSTSTATQLVWKRAGTAAHCIAHNLYLLVPLRWTLRCKHSPAPRRQVQARHLTNSSVIWRIPRLWPMGVEHAGESSADLYYICNILISITIYTSASVGTFRYLLLYV